jgi:antidote-toxin recognition MazE-like antitoxin
MPRTTQNPKRETLNLRIDPALKADFVAASEEQNKPVAEVLRELMQAYVEHEKRRKFVAEARRQSRLIGSSQDEAEALRWIEDVSDTKGWK